MYLLFYIKNIMTKVIIKIYVKKNLQNSYKIRKNKSPDIKNKSPYLFLSGKRDQIIVFRYLKGVVITGYLSGKIRKFIKN